MTPITSRRAKVVKAQAQPLPGSWIIETGGGGGTGGGPVGPAPPVWIDPVAEVIFRNNQVIEVDVIWVKAASATSQNFSGVAVYLEDPDISSGSQIPLDASVVLDGSAQMSGNWAPARETDSYASPAVVFPDSQTTYTQSRNVRIYLASFGPNSQPMLVRANEPGATPNIMVEIPIGPGQGESGMEWAFLITNPRVDIQTDYNRPDPQYYLTFFYDPPDPTAPVPPGVNRFGGVRIVFVYEDASGNPLFPGTDTGINVPVEQSQNGYKSPAYKPAPGGGQFRVYFCSEDDSKPLGSHVNSLVEGVTPFVEVVITGPAAAPDVTNFTISDQKYIWQLDGSFVAQATFSWDLPSGADNVRYAGVYLYLVNVTGATPPYTKFPQPLTGQQSNVDKAFILDIPPPPIPSNPEVWTIAAISVDNNGVLADHPNQYGQASFHSPTVTWNVGPPQPGSPGGCREFAPFVAVDPGATATANETLSADGVGMVSFDVGTWKNPTDNQFGGAQLAMVVNNDPTTPTYWSIPSGGTSFTTPTMPSFGNIGAPVPVDFYVVSDDPQGHRNTLCPGTTPVIHYTYTPSEGAVIPAREGWFDPSQFAWDESAGGFQAQSFSAKVVQVGKTLVVGGAPASFGGSDNGQIAVMNSSGVLRAWMGEQQPGQGDGQPKWGAWFGQLWVGGTNPLDAPLWIDNQGIIEVGGIAAAQGSQYPYISIRDDHGFEKGRIGAKISQPSGLPGDGTGSSPPLQLTSGAWFTQLAIGGSNLSNWNVLVVPDPDPANPLGSTFQMRNVYLFSIDYPAKAGSPAMEHYQLQFGNSVWMAGGLNGGWNFPGIHMYQVDNVGNNFGATFLSRGIVLRGTQQQGYHVLASLVAYNGQDSGSSFPAQFWGELAMYSPFSPNYQTVYLASGSASNGSGWFVLRNVNNGLLFEVDQSGNTFVAGVLQGAPAGGASTPVNALAYNVSGYGPVIDAQGKWVGQPIPGGAQTPWTQPINGAGFPLSNAGNISANGNITASQYMVNASGNPVIDANGAFRGAGVDVGGFGIGCGYLNTRGGELDCGLLRSANNIVCGSANPTTLPQGGWIVGDNLWALSGVNGGSFWLAGVGLVINGFGQFVGPGIDVGNNGIRCTYLAVGGSIDVGPISANGDIHGNRFFVNAGSNPVIDQFGAFRGAGIDVTSANGIGCGYLTTYGGRIDCGAINCSGGISFGSINVAGDFSAARYLVKTGALCINENGAFVGPGCDVGYQGIGCGYLVVRANWIDCPEVHATNEIHCKTLRIAEWITTNEGWALVSPDHHVWVGDLYANYWSGSQPVISRDGWYRGAGVDVGYNPVYCGVIDVRGGNINSVGTVNCSTVSAGNQVYAGNGFTGGTFFGASIQTGGQCYAGGGYAGGAFRGAGIDVGGYGISCGYLSTRGGTVDTGVVNASSYVNTNGILIAGVQKCSSNGVWTGSVQCYDNVFGTQLGIMNVGIGWPQGPLGWGAGAQASFATGDGRRVYVSGGLIVNVF